MNGIGLKTLNNGHELDIRHYKKVFNIFHEEYVIYCKEWLEYTGREINLKRKYICDIYQNTEGIEKEFKSYMDSYLEGILNLSIAIIERIDKECDLYFRWRIKDYASIIHKIYNKSKEQNGRFPINKCLNDLLGFRIVDINYDENIECIKEHLEYLRDSEHRIKHVDGAKDGYKGYHIYFNGISNHCFPMELQIWNSRDERNNLDLHKIYKQEYINWLDKHNNI